MVIKSVTTLFVFWLLINGGGHIGPVQRCGGGDVEVNDDSSSGH